MPRVQNRKAPVRGKTSAPPAAPAAAPTNRPRWFEIQNLAEPGTAEIKLYGYIGAPQEYRDYWTGETCEDPEAAGTVQEFADALEELGDIQQLQISIFSQGGDWATGVGIHNLLMRHPAQKLCVIDGLCASAATYPAMACDEIRIPSNASMLIHEAIGCECGDAQDLRAYADNLDAISNNIAQLYAARTGKSTDEICALMKEDRYLSGQECVDLGLADTLVEPLANMAARAGSLAPTNHASLRHAPAEVLALFDMRGIANVTRHTARKPAITNLPTPQNMDPQPSSTPAPAPAAASAPVTTGEPATAPQNVITLDQVNNLISTATKPLQDTITAQATEIENLKKAGLQNLAGAPPVAPIPTAAADKKVINRADFDKLTPGARAQFLRDGGRLTD